MGNFWWVLHPQHFSNSFTMKFKWQVVIGSNLILPLKLLFCPHVTIMWKSCENVVNIVFFTIFFVQPSMDQNFGEVKFLFRVLKVFLGWPSLFSRVVNSIFFKLYIYIYIYIYLVRVVKWPPWVRHGIDLHTRLGIGVLDELHGYHLWYGN